MLPASLIDPLSRYLDEEEGRSALATAAAALKTQAVDMAELLDWVQAQTHADAERRRQASTALRAALGLRFDRHVMQGARMNMDEAIAFAVGGELRHQTSDHDRDLAPLTPREREVATLIAAGASDKAIAAALVLSPRTVESHVGRILAKLDLSSRTQIAAWVAERGAGDVAVDAERFK